MGLQLALVTALVLALLTSVLAADDDVVRLTSSINCEELSPNLNVIVTCMDDEERNIGCGGPKTQGTQARYECKKYYQPHEKYPEEHSQMVCQNDGTWSNSKFFNQFSCQEDCGRKWGSKFSFIINGTVTSGKEWPWHVAIFRYIKQTGWELICGGSVIRSSVILTAAHCVRFKRPAILKIVVGATSSTYENNLKAPDAQFFDVRRSYIPETYDKRTLQADIAIVEIDGTVEFSEDVATVCLPDFEIDYHGLQPGRIGQVVGFGRDERGNASLQLKQGNLEIISDEECFASFNRALSETQFCAGNLDSKGVVTVCDGDSGGGLFIPSTVHQKHFIHGIVSFGDPPAKDLLCRGYGVFTRVVQFLSWIYNNLERISGERSLELASKIPFILRGVIHEDGHGVTRSKFLGFPREWTHRIESIEMEYTDVHPDLFFRSLQETRTVKSIRLFYMNFDTELGQPGKKTRIYLPYLETFILDYANKEKFVVGSEVSAPTAAGIWTGNSNYDTNNEQGFYQFQEPYLKSLLFFDKECKTDPKVAIGNSSSGRPITWKFEHVLRLGIDIRLTISVFHIFGFGHDEGLLLMYRMVRCNDILSNIPSYFKLKDLRLGFVDVKLEILQHLFTQHGSTLKHLIMYSPFFGRFDRRKGTLSAELLKLLPKLETLVFFWPVGTWFAIEYTIDLVEISRFVKTLKLGHMSRIEMTRPVNFTQLENFYCENCEFAPEVIQDFPQIFNTIKILILINGTQSIDLKLLTEVCPNLERVYISTPKVNYSDFNVDSFTPYWGTFDNSTQNFLLLRNLGGNAYYTFPGTSEKWVIVPSSSAASQHVIEFGGRGLTYFHTSFTEYELGKRQTRSELSAYQTGIFKYDGLTSGGVGGKGYMASLSLSSYVLGRLSRMDISNVVVSPVVLQDALKLSTELEQLVLHNIELTDTDTGFLPVALDQVKQYKLLLSGTPDTFLFQASTNVTYFQTLFPFFESKGIIPGSKSSTKLSYPQDIYTDSSMEIVDIIVGGCRIFYFNKTNPNALELVMSADFNGILSSNMPLAYLGLTYPNQFVGTRIPSSLVKLNLDSLEANSSDFSLLFKKLTKLRNLRFSRNLVPKEESFYHTPSISLKDLSETIEYLELRKVYVTYSSLAGMIIFPDHVERYKSFKNLDTLYCTGDVEFDEDVISNFGVIFPSVTRLAVLYVDDFFWYWNHNSTKVLLVNILEDTVKHNVELLAITMMGWREDITNYDALLDNLIKAGATSLLHGPPLFRQHFLLRRRNSTSDGTRWTVVEPDIDSDSLNMIQSIFSRSDTLGFDKPCFLPPGNIQLEIPGFTPVIL